MTRPIYGALLALALFVPGAMAQQPFNKEDLIKSLQASGGSGATVDVEAIKKDLKNVIAVEPATPSGPATRGLDAQPQSRAIAVLADKPSISVEVFFDYNSAAIKPESMAQLNVLGQALQDARLSGGRFLIGGHTDGKGSRDYNLKLSQDRADAIRRFLISAFPIDAARLATIGFGEEQLRDPANPEAAINRRVQIVNIGN